MSEYDQANFKGVYQGQSLVISSNITEVPWEIGSAQPEVCRILDALPPGRLLDVGCGLGRNARAAFERGHKVVAIDIAEDAIAASRRHHAGLDIHFEVRDACQTELEPGFDILLDSATYHAIPSTSRLAYLKEMRRLAHAQTRFHLMTFATSVYGMPRPLSSHLSEIVTLAEEAGWSIHTVERVDYRGNAVAIQDFAQKKGLNIQLDDQGRTLLPSWHVELHPAH
ncbi:class I SAM-dependent methyltransferase [Aeromonas popoffii]|uniref:class I SAM-dependent methyltransferase n=1 Tax=Aeromonas popoffii TaxID=70856 RepID=UPI0005A9CE12|nr:class I SAM-dependent methyltransferase [Aeromonas popoffii]